MNKRDKSDFESMAVFFENAARRALADANGMEDGVGNEDKQRLVKYAELFERRAMLCRKVSDTGRKDNVIVYEDFLGKNHGKN